LRLFSFGGYGLALAALALVVFGAYDSYPDLRPKNTWLSGCTQTSTKRIRLRLETGNISKQIESQRNEKTH